MRLDIPDDSRKLLIDTFFAIIITLGFENFLLHFGVTTNFSKIEADRETLFNITFFFSTYFWIISHWIFYHELIKRYPYRSWTKFFVDIVLFSLMFVILNISFGVYNSNTNLLLFILLIAVWYTLACLWHTADKKFRSPERYHKAHRLRYITYYSIFVLFAVFSLANPFSIYRAFGETIRDSVMISTIAAMIILNVDRLNRFILRRDIISECCLFFNDDRLAEFPECYLPQFFSIQVFNMCYKNNSLTSCNKIVYESPYQIRNNSVKKYQSTHLVEFLILLWMGQVTAHQEKEFIGVRWREEPVPLTSIIKPPGGNIFLEKLPFLTTDDRSEKTILDTSIHLPKSVEAPEFCQTDAGKPYDYNKGKVLLKGSYFDMEITYERLKNNSPSGFIPWERKAGVAVNPVLFNDMSINKSKNMHVATYKLEFYTSHKWKACLRCFLKSIGKEISWLSKTAETFKELDINAYIANLEKITTLRKTFEDTITSQVYPSCFLETNLNDPT